MIIDTTDQDNKSKPKLSGNSLTINDRINMFISENAEIYIIPYLDKSDHIKMQLVSV